MPPPLLFDISDVDLEKIAVSRDEIYAALPHRYEFALLDGLNYCSDDSYRMVGFKEITADDWWTRGHIPGRPLFPGVLMIEAGAQLAAYMASKLLGGDQFIGFGGVDGVKFRQAVTPPSRLYILGQGLECRKRRVVCQVQGLIDGVQAFEAKITGMPV